MTVTKNIFPNILNLMTITTDKLKSTKEMETIAQSLIERFSKKYQN